MTLNDPFAQIAPEDDAVTTTDPFAQIAREDDEPSVAPQETPKLLVPQMPYMAMPEQAMTLGNLGGVTPSFVPRLGQAPVLNPLPDRQVPFADTVDRSSLGTDWNAGVAQAKQGFNALPFTTNLEGINITANEIARLEAERDAALAKGLNNQANTIQVEINKRQRQLVSRGEAIPNALLNIAEAQKVIDASPINPTAKQFLDKHTAANELWGLFKQDPYAVSRTIVARSLPSSAPSIAGTVLGGMAGGPLGAAAGAFASGFAMEFGSAIIESMSELGANPDDPEQYKAIFEANKDAILKDAMIKAGIISGADAATGGLASKVARMPMKALSPGLAKGAKVGSAIGLDAIGGGGGEALSQLATKGEIENAGAIAAEVIGSTVMGPLEIIGQNDEKTKNKGASTNGEPPLPPDQQAPGVGALFGVEQNPNDPFATFAPDVPNDPFASIAVETAPAPVPPATEATIPVTPTEDVTTPVIPGDGTTPVSEGGVSTPPLTATPSPQGGTAPVSPATAGNPVPPVAPPSPEQPAGTPPAASSPSSPQGATPTEGQRGPSTGIWAPITKGESGGDYNILVFGKPGASVPRRADLTNMTIAQVQDYQRGMRDRGHASSAVGRWQMIESTLAMAAKGLGLDPNTTKFDQATQDRMAQWLLDEKVGMRQWREGKMSDAQFAANLRNEWEALAKAGYSDKQLIAMVNENGIIGDGYVGVPQGEGYTAGAGTGTATPGFRGDEITPTTPTTQQNAGPNVGVSVPDAAFEQQRAAFAAAPKVESASFPENTVSATGFGKVETKPMVVDLASIITSDHPNYNQSLQPRDRANAQPSDAQINRIANELDPNLLMPQPLAAHGAPIVNDLGMVESGNGRLMALRKAFQYNLPGAQAYREKLQSLGFNTAGMSMPVLVQQRMTPLTPEQAERFTYLANKPDVLGLSRSEEAKVDAKFFTKDRVARLKPGQDPADNTDLVRDFINNMTIEERRDYLTDDGELNIDGAKRIQNGVFAAAYGNPQALKRIAESKDNEIKAISNALLMAAPYFAKLRGMIADGAVDPALDQSDNLAKAANIIADYKRRGEKIATRYQQQDAFASEDRDPYVEAFIKLMHNETMGRQLSAKAIAEDLRYYAEEAMLMPPNSLAGETPPAHTIVSAVAKRRGRELEEFQNDFADGSGNTDSPSLFGDGGDGTSVPASDGQGPDALRPQKQRPVQDQGRERNAGQPESDVNGRPESSQPDRGRQGGDTNRQDANQRPQRDTAPNRDGQEEVKGESQRAVETRKPSDYEDVFADLGYDPVEAKLWPIEKQFKVISEGIKTKFGLAHVDKTPKTISKYAVDQLKDAYRNLQFMAGILQISNQAIGLDKFFGLTIRKGTDEYLGAFYPNGRAAMEGLPEGGRSIVSPGRTNTFAHEWGHALDYKLSEIFRGADKDGNLKSLVEYVAMLDRMGSKKLDQNVTDRAEQQKLELARAVSEVTKAIFFQADGKTPTDFQIESARFANAQKNGDYWVRAREMFSRAFEAYVALNAERFGGTNQFLGLPDRVYAEAKDGFVERVYPRAADRMRLFKAFDDLMVAIRTNTDLSGGAAMFPGNPTILPSAWSSALGPRMNTPSKKELFLNEFKFIRSMMRGVSKIAINAKNADYREAAYIFRRGFNYLFASMRGAMMSIQARRQSDTLQKLIDQLTPVPGVAKATERTYEEAREWAFRQFDNILGRIVKRYGVDKYTPEQLALLRKLLITGGSASTNFKDIVAPQGMKEAAAMMRQLMDKMYYYGRVEGNLDIGYTKNGYLPRILNEMVVSKNRNGFIRDAAKVYDIQFQREIAADADAVSRFDPNGDEMKVWEEVVADAERAGAISYADRRMHADALRALRDDPTDENKELFREAVEEIYDAVREHYAKSSAEQWYAGITEMSPEQMFRDAPPSRFTKKRSLPPEADTIMADYYYNNPVDLIRRYASSMTRKVEFSKRFGPTGQKFYDSLEQMRQEGLTDDELRTITEFFQRITGTEGQKPNWGTTALNTIYVASTMRLMLRSLFTNLFEPFVVSLRTGNIGDAGRVVKGVAQELGYSVASYWSGEGKSDVQFMRDMAEFCGIVSDTLTEQLVQQHISDQMSVPEWMTNASARFYENIGLAGYTRVSRRVAMKIGFLELERSSKKLLAGGDTSKPRMVFNEGGIPDAMQEDFARWFLENYGDGRRTDLGDIEEHPMTPYLQTFLARWTDQTLQDPKRVDKPYYATGTLSRFPYGLLSFGYAFFNNVVKRAIRIAAGKGDLSGAERAKFIAATGGMASLYIMTQIMAGVARSENFGDDEERKKKRLALGKLMSGEFDGEVADLVMEGVSRSGFFGPLDPAVQFAYTLARGEKSARYEATIPKLAFGPQIGSLVDDAIRIANVTDKKNVEGTTTSEFNMSRGLYNVGVGFLTVGALGLTPLGPLGALALGNPFYGAPQVTTPKVRDSMIEQFTPYEKPETPEQKRKGRPPGVPGTGVRAYR